jgi:hypothetical protein
LILVCGAEAKPLVEPARGVDFYHAKSDHPACAPGFLDERLHETAANALLEPPVQIKLLDRDDFAYALKISLRDAPPDRRRGQEPSASTASPEEQSQRCTDIGNATSVIPSIISRMVQV